MVVMQNGKVPYDVSGTDKLERSLCDLNRRSDRTCRARIASGQLSMILQEILFANLSENVRRSETDCFVGCEVRDIDALIVICLKEMREIREGRGNPFL